MKNTTEQQTKVIRYYRQSVYGNELFYAVDNTEAIARLTGRRTIIKSDFQALKDLGFEFQEILKSEIV